MIILALSGVCTGKSNYIVKPRQQDMWLGLFWVLLFIFIVWVLHGQVDIRTKLVKNWTNLR